MALKTKKGSLFGEQKNSDQEDVRDQERGMEESDGEPYKVFETKEEFDEAVKKEAQKMSGTSQPREMNNGYMMGRSGSLVEAWQREARALKEIIPEFELAEAIRQPAFTDILRRGGSILEAYAAISRLPKQPERDSIYQNAQMAQRGTGEASRNPARLSSEDFKEYIENIRNR